MDILVAYDIAGTNTPEGASRLRRVANICSAYGQRVQWSVFECRLSPIKYTMLIDELAQSIDPSVDSILIYRLPGSIHEHRTSIGVDRGHRLGTPWIV